MVELTDADIRWALDEARTAPVSGYREVTRAALAVVAAQQAEIARLREQYGALREVLAHWRRDDGGRDGGGTGGR